MQGVSQKIKQAVGSSATGKKLVDVFEKVCFMITSSLWPVRSMSIIPGAHPSSGFHLVDFYHYKLFGHPVDFYHYKLFSHPCWSYSLLTWACHLSTSISTSIPMYAYLFTTLFVVYLFLSLSLPLALPLPLPLHIPLPLPRLYPNSDIYL